MTKKIKPPKSIYMTMSASTPSLDSGTLPESVSFSPAGIIKRKSIKPITFAIDSNLLSFINDDTVTVEFIWHDDQLQPLKFPLNSNTITNEHCSLSFPATKGKNNYYLSITSTPEAGDIGSNSRRIEGEIIVRD